jgi:hypothetical protein
MQIRLTTAMSRWIRLDQYYAGMFNGDAKSRKIKKAAKKFGSSQRLPIFALRSRKRSVVLSQFKGCKAEKSGRKFCW